MTMNQETAIKIFNKKRIRSVWDKVPANY